MSQSLKSKTLFGLIWSAVESFSTQTIAFSFNLFIARLLSPSAYGTVALATAIFAIANVFVDSGFATALIRKIDRTESDFCTVFYFNIAIGFLATAIIFCCAPLVAAFYDIPELVNIVRVLSLTILIGSFGAVHRTMLTINIDFKKQTKVSFCAVLLSGIFGLGAAYSGFGIWSLVIQSITSVSLTTLFFWITLRWVPRQGFSIRSFKPLFAYGSRLLISRLITCINGNIAVIVVGKAFTPATLGVYSRARHLANFPSSNLTNIMNRVTLPVLSTIQNDDVRLEVNYRKMLKVSAFVIIPAMAGLSALAEPVILFLLGDKWAAAIPILQVVCFSLMLYPTHAINLNLLQVKGRPEIFLRLAIIKQAISIITLFAFVPFGIMALCYGRILASVISLFINTYYTGKLINIGFIKQSLDLLPIFFISMLMWTSIRYIIDLFDCILLQLVVGSLSGIVIYVALAYLLRLDSIQPILELLSKNKST